MSYASISLHFDSLWEAYGFPRGYQDPSFSTLADRIFRIVDDLGIKLSIYLIGRDLEREESRTQVRKWAAAGHEIGNHSLSHRYDLGALPRAEIDREIGIAHEMITDAAGKPPRGFSAPFWSTSRRLFDSLCRHGYTYDASLFPSWLRYGLLARSLLNYFGHRRMYSVLRQKHLLYPILGSRMAKMYNDRMVLMPMPTNRWGVACWHTTVFQFGWQAHRRLLHSCLRSVEAFYYVIHPADVLAPQDLDRSRRLRLFRVEVPLEVKLRYLQQAIETIVSSGRKIITMEQLAEHAAARLAARGPEL